MTKTYTLELDTGAFDELSPAEYSKAERLGRDCLEDPAEYLGYTAILEAKAEDGRIVFLGLK